MRICKSWFVPLNDICCKYHFTFYSCFFFCHGICIVVNSALRRGTVSVSVSVSKSKFLGERNRVWNIPLSIVRPVFAQCQHKNTRWWIFFSRSSSLLTIPYTTGFGVPFRKEKKKTGNIPLRPAPSVNTQICPYYKTNVKFEPNLFNSGQ